jgi:hypothetical protein
MLNWVFSHNKRSSGIFLKPPALQEVFIFIDINSYNKILSCSYHLISAAENLSVLIQLHKIILQ